MKTVMELLRKPLVKIIGLVLVMYFGLFYDKKNPDGLGNRLSSERIAANFNEAQEKSTFILSNLEKARKLRGGAPVIEGDSLQNFSVVTVQDTAFGTGDDIVKCGDEVEISYDIRAVGSNNQLTFIPKEKLIIGSNSNALLERKIIGMKSKGTRSINVPRDFKSNNQKLAALLKFNEVDLQYNVELLNFHPSNNSDVHCTITKDEPNKNVQ